ncbi:hypothetical protein A2W24_02655 [Microgenomates group bacterium RBG_16_45_19]|nr:MAG: hypothetical protein A2W24_02655 [Microgenomates group bacterium RBG_16_45_19]
MSSEIITREEIGAVQRQWGDGVVAIGKTLDKREECERAAWDHVNGLYGYDIGPVLFKPTMTVEVPFRDTAESAVAYFIGGNQKYPEDHGFALNQWQKVRFENNQVIEGNQAFAQGVYYFSGADGKETPVVYTFGYVRDEAGNIKINVHHSSLFPSLHSID